MDLISGNCTISLLKILLIKENHGKCHIWKPFQFKSTLNRTSFKD